MCFAEFKIKYLGHVIGSGRHGPDTEKLRATESIEALTSKTNLMSAIGLFNYYCNYIRNYAKAAKLLTDLTKKNVPKNIP